MSTDEGYAPQRDYDAVMEEFHEWPAGMAMEILRLRYVLRMVRESTRVRSRAGQWARSVEPHFSREEILRFRRKVG